MINPAIGKNKLFTVNSQLDNTFGDSELVVYTDGSCNKQRTKAGIGVYFDNKNEFQN